MAIEKSNTWCNFSYGNSTYAPKGCLLNPEGSKLIFFEKSKKSQRNNIKVFTHLFYTNHLGEPAGLKSSSQICLDEAWDRWQKLQAQGWTEVSYNYG